MFQKAYGILAVNVKTTTQMGIDLTLKRITIMLDEELLKKLREIQVKRIRKSSKSISLSSVLNDTLRKELL